MECLASGTVLKWQPANSKWTEGAGAKRNVTASADQPCRRACTACDLGPICQNLLLKPMQLWSAEHTLNWLIDTSGIATVELAAAFVRGSVEIIDTLHYRHSGRDWPDADTGWLFCDSSVFARPDLFDDGPDTAADRANRINLGRASGGFDEFGRFKHLFSLKPHHYGLVH